MARCPFAVWRPLPESGSQPLITATQAILHSAVDAPGPTSLYPYFARADVTLESHFFIKLDGTIEQYIDTSHSADANRWANERAVSIETEDEGNPDQRPWTPAQIRSIGRLLDWLCDTHPIPRRACTAWDAPGIGYHSMWGAPSPWTPAKGKTCPGAARIRQFPSIIQAVRLAAVPTVPKKKDPFMALTDAEQKEILDGIRLLTPFKPERINRKGEADPDGVRADPSVRWAIETVLASRRTATVVREVVKAEVQAAAAAGGIDPEAVAEKVVAALGSALSES